MNGSRKQGFLAVVFAAAFAALAATPLGAAEMEITDPAGRVSALQTHAYGRRGQ